MTVKTFLTHFLPSLSLWVIYTVVLMTSFDRFFCLFFHVSYCVFAPCLCPSFPLRFHLFPISPPQCVLEVFSLRLTFCFYLVSISFISPTSCNCLWALISTHSCSQNEVCNVNNNTLQKLKKYSVGPFKHFALVQVNYAELLLQHQQVICDQITAVEFFIPSRKC